MLSRADLGPADPEQFLAVNARPRGDSNVVLEVVGHVDAFTAPLLRACLHTQLSRPGLRELVVDVGGAEFLDAAGAAVLVEAMRRCLERGLRFRLRAQGRWRGLRALESDVAAPLPLAG